MLTADHRLRCRTPLLRLTGYCDCFQLCFHQLTMTESLLASTATYRDLGPGHINTSLRVLCTVTEVTYLSMNTICSSVK